MGSTAAAPRPAPVAGGLLAGLPYLAVSVCLFGGVWPVTKAGLAHATPLWFAFNRAAMAAAAAALLLAALGVYGIVAYSVAQRSREFGIRVALGAQPAQIIGMVVAQNLRIVVIGVAIGLAAAIPVTRLLGGLLFQVRPNDPATFAGIGMALAIVALVASYIPARRGTRVDPIATLRSE